MVTKNEYFHLVNTYFIAIFLKVYVCNGVGLQVLTTLVPALLLQYCFNKLRTRGNNKTTYCQKQLDK